VYLIFACIGLVSFLWKRFVFISWISLLIVSVLHIFFYVSDASLGMDIHGFLIFLDITFLFIPNKISLIRYGVLSYYLISVWRELSPDWLSGANLIGQLPLPTKGLEWLAAVGVLIKITLPFLLVSPFGQRLTLAILGLLTYHSFLFYFQRDFSSLAMGLLVLFFVVDFFERKRLERESYYQSYAHPEPSKLWWPIVLGLYLLVQFNVFGAHSPTQLLHIDGPAAAIECQQMTFVKFKHQTEQRESLLPGDMKSEFRCHPLLAFNAAKQLCRELQGQPEFESIATYFLRRRLSEVSFQPLFSIDNICSPDVTYKNALAVKP
jgi:hypothetical protein